MEGLQAAAATATTAATATAAAGVPGATGITAVESWRRSSAPSPQQNPVGYLNLERFVCCCLKQLQQQQQQTRRAGCFLFGSCLRRVTERQQRLLLAQSFASWRCQWLAEAEAARAAAAETAAAAVAPYSGTTLHKKYSTLVRSFMESSVTSNGGLSRSSSSSSSSSVRGKSKDSVKSSMIGSDNSAARRAPCRRAALPASSTSSTGEVASPASSTGEVAAAAPAAAAANAPHLVRLKRYSLEAAKILGLDFASEP
ncbi:hypothetical protein, conserved [Eimeria necatrix]|uniref:Uncharacterized protein n=1 Tax=Eimeria necatrix TaxID=51315 RepID=U6MTN2_9EIME|nr:hypothetical protein, conserved [Eimeria necatrix]CDJ65015.1 hypothetical protein, conserved [Eimeria necatrix]